MTNQQHPITPPPELVQQWCEQLFGCPDKPEIAAYELVRLGAQYGADQELQACCELAGDDLVSAERLRAARRPKPLSLAEEALEALNSASVNATAGAARSLRRALKRLQELENNQ